MFERSLEELGFVGNATLDFTSMNVVKFFIVKPLGLKVVDFKAAIRGNPVEELAMFR